MEQAKRADKRALIDKVAFLWAHDGNLCWKIRVLSVEDFSHVSNGKLCSDNRIIIEALEIFCIFSFPFFYSYTNDFSLHYTKNHKVTKCFVRSDTNMRKVANKQGWKYFKSLPVLIFRRGKENNTTDEVLF